jgi:NMD protein affecting ribosome stability and mRNA decay
MIQEDEKTYICSRCGKVEEVGTEPEGNGCYHEEWEILLADKNNIIRRCKQCGFLQLVSNSQ